MSILPVSGVCEHFVPTRGLHTEAIAFSFEDGKGSLKPSSENLQNDSAATSAESGETASHRQLLFHLLRYLLHLSAAFLSQKANTISHCNGSLRVSFDLQFHAGHRRLQSLTLPMQDLFRRWEVSYVEGHSAKPVLLLNHAKSLPTLPPTSAV